MTNRMISDIPSPHDGTGVLEFWSDRIVYEKPNDPYYYYIYFFNEILKGLDLFQYRSLHGRKNTQIYIPNEIKEDIDNGLCKILLDYSLEGFPVDTYHVPNFINFLQSYKDNVVFLTGDYKCSTGTFIETCYCNYWEKIVSKNLNNKDICEYRKQKLNQHNPARFKAICKNRLLREHRIAIVKNIHDYDLVDSINYSFGIVTEHGPRNSLNYTHEMYTDKVTHSAHMFKHNSEELLYWITRHGEKNLYHERVNLSENHATTINSDLLLAHLDSYFEIVTETSYNNDTIFHSEKTFKAISFLQPFVLCAERYSVQALREMGYDVFDDIIDHRYDAIQDSCERLHATFAEIKRLCSISDSKWLQLLQILRPRLIKNLKHLEQANQRHNV